jgi:hypothetical protein
MLETEKIELLELVRANWPRINQCDGNIAPKREYKLAIWAEILAECKARGHAWAQDPTKDAAWYHRKPDSIKIPNLFCKLMPPNLGFLDRNGPN